MERSAITAGRYLVINIIKMGYTHDFSLGLCQYIDMLCIYCSNETKVGNSRPTNQGKAVWRRRVCKTCKAAYTTIESPDLAQSIVVSKKSGNNEPFFETKLLLSITKAAGKHSNHVDIAQLARTITSKAIAASKDGRIDTKTLNDITSETLKNYDIKMNDRYSAYSS